MKTYQKTLLAVTLGALTATASADVILYGQIRGGVEVSKEKVANKVLSDKMKEMGKGTTTNIVDLGSRIGFKGHEHLNGDLKAIWQLEQRVDIGGGRDSDGNIARGFGTRTSFIGLESNTAGRVRAGYLDTPVNYWNGEYLDPWYYSNNALGLGGFTRGTDATGRRVAVDYYTPRAGGFTAGVFVSPSDNNSTSGRDSAVYGAALDFKNDQVFANAAGTYVKNGKNNQSALLGNKAKKGYQAVAQFGVDNGTTLLGVGYQYASNVDKAANFGYSDNRDGNGGKDIALNNGVKSIERAQEVALTAAYKTAGGLRLKGSAAYGFGIKAIETDATAASGYSTAKLGGNGKYVQGVVGADYELSKRTRLGAQVGYLQAGKGDDKVKNMAVGTGLVHKF